MVDEQVDKLTNTEVANWAINDLKPWQFISGIAALAIAVTTLYFKVDTAHIRLSAVETKIVATDAKINSLEKQILEALHANNIRLTEVQSELKYLREARTPRPQ